MIMSFQVICFGEVLWDNLNSGKRIGGAPLNVCYHLGKQGIKSEIISKIGSDTNGEEILKELKRLNVSSKFCFVDHVKPTSVVEVYLGNENQVEYDIVEDVAWDYIEFTSPLGDIVANSDMLVFGSLATRSNMSFKTLCKLIDKSSYKVFDVNMRPPYHFKENILTLMSNTDLLKLNLEELKIISDWFGDTSLNVDTCIEKLLNRFLNIKEIILTKGSNGAAFYSVKEKIEVSAYNVIVKDTIGSGDSFLAAFLANKLKGTSIKTALLQASLLSGFVTASNGACPDYTTEILESFKNEMNKNTF
ncbi:MAG: carbohydrate kinase [Ignavibacteriae bacterium]|nr:carbohydrate kinase [Ignavibacteriota bacterium]